MHSVQSLKSEYLINPIGIGVTKPRFNWIMADDSCGAMQTSYHIQAATTIDLLNADKANLWDSGKIASDQSIHVQYNGKELSSRSVVYWRVKIWNENNVESAWSEVATFEIGLLNNNEWTGQWIGTDIVGGKNNTAPVPFLRKEININDDVASARLYITALGLYEPYINGEKVGVDLFTPGWTDYTKRLQYRVYDVTENMQKGSNAIGVILGDGWYAGHISWEGRMIYGDRPKLMAQLEVTLKNGEKIVITTDESWKFSTGPIVESDIYMGETYDANREICGWDKAGYDDTKWRPVFLFDEKINLVASPGPAMRVQELLKPISPVNIRKDWSNTFNIYDMGQNMVGNVCVKMKGKKGTTVKIRYAEILDKGQMYTTNLRSARSTDYYTFKNDEVVEYMPKFTFHGFRYVEFTGIDTENILDVTGMVIHSNMEATSEFECNDQLINQLQHNIIWGQKGNYIDIPTDCPQRDERLGWTGDAQVFIRTAAFNFDVAPFFTKWLIDMVDSQNTDGSYPSVVPAIKSCSSDGGPAWADAGIICPWTIYKCYGDTAILSSNYASMKRYMQHLLDTSDGLIRPPIMYGDWLSINADTPRDLIGTAFFAYDATLMSEIATVLNFNEDAKYYSELFEKIKTAFLNRYVTPDGLIASGTQTSYLLALHFNLLNADKVPLAIKKLVEDMESRGNKISTGFVGSPYVNLVLTANGKNDMAYKLMHQTEWPSWLYAVTQGATTIWERWDGWTHDKGFQDAGMNSFNHYAYGAIGAWLYSQVAGIDLIEPAYKHSIIAPKPGGNIDRACAKLQTMYGEIISNWKIEDGIFNILITVPANTKSTIILPVTGEVTKNGKSISGEIVEKGIKFDVSAGNYTFKGCFQK
jgi:alpha-L-rhamnosidase